MALINSDAQSAPSTPPTELLHSAETDRSEDESLDGGVAPPPPAVLPRRNADVDPLEASSGSNSVAGRYQSRHDDDIGVGDNMGVDGRPAAVRRRYAEHRKRCVVNRRRCYVIAGVGIAGILVTAGAMAFAGCAYDRIQLAVTVEAMAVAAMFTPAYANSIA